jgi:hypothetical protein
VRPYLAWISGNGTLPENARRAKADYWDVWSDLFGENYFSRLSSWCQANHLEYICHLDKDDSNPMFVRTGGDYFKDMRHVGIPGIDVIWAQIWFDHEADYPKLASSAAHLFGKPHAFTESFAAFTNPVDVPTAKWVIDYQLVRGINLVTAMAMSASSGGRGGGTNAVPGTTAGAGPALAAATNAAATATTQGVAGAGRKTRSGGAGGGNASATPRGPRFYTMPGFPAVAQYVHRASYLLSLGTPAAQVGVVMPTTSLWLGDTASDTSNLAIAQKLLETQRDFDWVDERSLASVLKLEGRELKNQSGQSYRAIIVPSLRVISQTALDRLQAFAKAGGSVILLGRTPAIVTERSFLHASGAPDLKWALVESSGEFTPRLLAALPKPDVTLDPASTAVKYQHRSWRDAELYFFFNEGTKKQSCQATLTGNGQAQFWDAMSGRIGPVAGASSANGAVRVPLVLEPHGTVFIVVGARL